MDVAEFNALADADARAVVAAWAAVPPWVDRIVTGRPYPTAAALAERAAELASMWTTVDLDAALSAHPRIGEPAVGGDRAAAASRREQALISTAEGDVAAAIASGNDAYERRFGRIFLIRAAGRTPEEILGELRRRLALDPAQEEREAIAQLAEIAALRLRSTVIDETVRAMSALTTHVLDATTGAPATGVRVQLHRADGAAIPAGEGRTDRDGRLRLGPERLDPGSYTLTFHTGEFFAARGSDTFYPRVDVVFRVPHPPADHYHVPLLLSPFAYSTYRGS